MKAQDTLNIYENLHSGLGDILELDEKNSSNRNQNNFLDFSSPDCRYETPVSLSSGGMKHIYKVYDKLCDRQIAMAVLKDLRSKNDFNQFINESTTTAKLEHPNIMPIYDLGHDDKGEPFFTMPLLTGENLADLIRREAQQKTENPAIALQNKMNMFLKICDAIAYSHSRDVIHLDLKPENIQTGPFGELLVCDWGLAYHMDAKQELKKNRVLCGTPGFIAPELKIAKVFNPTPRCDVYSLGVLLRCLITLRGPLDPDFMKDSENCPSGLSAIIDKAMYDDPELRYQTVMLLKDDLQNWMNGFAPAAQDANHATVFLLFCKRNIRTIFSCIAFSAILALTLYYKKENTSLNEKLDQTLPQSLEIEDLNDLNEIIDKHRRLMYNFKTKDAEKFANRALGHLPDEQNLLEISALSHLANMNFLDAHDKFSLIEGNLKLVSLINACKKLASKQKFTNDELINLFIILKDYEKELYINNLAYKLRNFLNVDQREQLFVTLLNEFNPYIENIKIVNNEITIFGSSPISDFSPLMLIHFSHLDISNIGTDDINEIIYFEPRVLKIDMNTYTKHADNFDKIRHEIVIPNL